MWHIVRERAAAKMRRSRPTRAEHRACLAGRGVPRVRSVCPQAGEQLMSIVALSEMIHGQEADIFVLMTGKEAADHPRRQAVFQSRPFAITPAR